MAGVDHSRHQAPRDPDHDGRGSHESPAAHRQRPETAAQEVAHRLAQGEGVQPIRVSGLSQRAEACLTVRN